jgi:desulfoferrodoxin (superoxide reductase-like protein)
VKRFLTSEHLISVREEINRLTDESSEVHIDCITLLNHVATKVGSLTEPDELEQAIGWGLRFFTHDIVNLGRFRESPEINRIRLLVLEIGQSLATAARQRHLSENQQGKTKDHKNEL